MDTKYLIILTVFCIALRLTHATSQVDNELTPECKDKIEKSCGKLTGVLIEVSVFGKVVLELGVAVSTVNTLISNIQLVLSTVITLVIDLLKATLTVVVKVVVGLLKFVIQTLRCLIPNLVHLLGCLLTAVATAGTKVVQTVTGLVNNLTKTLTGVLEGVITEILFVFNYCGGNGL